MASAAIFGLPEELINNICTYLKPKDFLRFCSTCHLFQDSDEIRHETAYWRSWVQATFRFPNMPTTSSDSQHWQTMYRRLLHTQVIYWGNNDGGAAGYLRPRGAHTKRPLPIDSLMEVGNGVIADLQCGGWSTTILTSEGQLYSVGRIAITRPRNGAAPERLRFGQVFDDTNSPEYRIRQFSQGHRNVVALSDSGRIWYWASNTHVATGVLFAGAETATVQKVQDGWGPSSALLKDHGLYIWTPGLPQGRSPGPEIYVLGDNFWIVPGIKRLVRANRMGKARSRDSKSDEEVVNWVILQGWIVWLTGAGRVYAAVIPRDTLLPMTPFELTKDSSVYLTDDSQSIVDIQGAHRNFGLFTLDGQVLLSNIDHLDIATRTGNCPFKKLPCMQHTGIIQLAFGDWHFHALHKDGSITSYGHEPESCGAMGLGPLVERGLKDMRHFDFPLHAEPDLRLLESCFSTGRRVVFESEKHAWLAALTRAAYSDVPYHGMNPDEWDAESAERSEWVERRLRSWDRFPPTIDPGTSLGGATNAPAYFPVGISAAGWHSAAMVIVDEDAVEQAREPFEVDLTDSLPLEGPYATSPGQVHMQQNGTWYTFREEIIPSHANPPAKVTNPDGPEDVPWETPVFQYEEQVTF